MQTFPYEVDPHSPEPAQFLSAASLLDPLPPQDQELLLLFSALLRHVVRASATGTASGAGGGASGGASGGAGGGGGAGCEEHVRRLCGWALRLLLGPQLDKAGAAAERAMTCLLW